MEPRLPLRQIWDQVPEVGCKGLCVEACGPIEASPEERALLEDRGIQIGSWEKHVLAILNASTTGDFSDIQTCPALVDGKCSVYEVRPLICRLYGAAEGLECEFGCVPAEGLLSREAAGKLIQRSIEIGQTTSRRQRRAQNRR